MSEQPRLRAPEGACDCHMHVYDRRYPASPAWPVAPPHAPASAYRDVQAALGLSRVVVVQPNAYVDDLHCTEDGDGGARARRARRRASCAPDVREAELHASHAGRHARRRAAIC